MEIVLLAGVLLFIAIVFSLLLRSGETANEKVEVPPKPLAPTYSPKRKVVPDKEREHLLYPLITCYGRFLVKDSHAVGKFGDQLTHIFFEMKNEGNTGALKFRKHFTKFGVQGIDAVYSESSGNRINKLFAIENKVRTSKFNKEQLTNEGLEKRALKLAESSDPKHVKTGSLLLEFLSNRQQDLQSVLFRYKLDNGTRSCFIFDRKINQLVEDEKNTKEIDQLIFKLLQQRIVKSTCRPDPACSKAKKFPNSIILPGDILYRTGTKNKKARAWQHQGKVYVD